MQPELAYSAHTWGEAPAPPCQRGGAFQPHEGGWGKGAHEAHFLTRNDQGSLAPRAAAPKT